MGATPSGLPWPEGTDLVRDGDNAMKALAEAVEARMWATGVQGLKFRHFGGFYATGADGRVWIVIPGITGAQGAVAQILGDQRWIARLFQVAGTSILFEVTNGAGSATINSTAMTFNIVAWGSA